MKKPKDQKIGEKLNANSKDHWEQRFPMTKGVGEDSEGALLPRPGKMRDQPHVKINECDH